MSQQTPLTNSTIASVAPTASAPASSKRTKCEVWTRVMGYHRPVSHFNIGKKSEHASRKHFVECKAANSQFVAQYAGAAVAAC